VLKSFVTLAKMKIAVFFVFCGLLGSALGQSNPSNLASMARQQAMSLISRLPRQLQEPAWMAYSSLIGVADGIGGLFGRGSSSYGRLPVTGSSGTSFMSAVLPQNGNGSQRQHLNSRLPSTGPGNFASFSGSASHPSLSGGFNGGSGLPAGVPSAYAQLIADGMRYQQLRASLSSLVDRMGQFYQLYRMVTETPGTPSLTGVATMLSHVLEGTSSLPSFGAQVSTNSGAAPEQASVTRDTIQAIDSNKDFLPTEEPAKPAEQPAATEARAKRETFAEQILSGVTGGNTSSNNKGSSSFLRTK